MNPARVIRARVKLLTDLPNIGEAIAADLRLIGIRTPDQLKGRDAIDLYERLAHKTGTRQDPCVLDTFMSIVSFMDGHPPRPWWDFTARRKRMLARGSTGAGSRRD